METLTQELDLNQITSIQRAMNMSLAKTPPSLIKNLPPRNNLDQTVNKTGRELVQLCRASGLYILNGRIRGDSLGRFTCCSGLGASVVDYTITDMDPSSFSAFTVIQQTPLSDHNQTNIYIKTSHTRTKPAGDLQIISGPAEIQMDFRQCRQIYPSTEF